MDTTILEGMWKDLRGKVKVWWSKLSDSDLDTVAGKFDILVGVLQEKYGISRRQAVQEISQRIISYRTGLRKIRSRSKYD